MHLFCLLRSRLFDHADCAVTQLRSLLEGAQGLLIDRRNFEPSGLERTFVIRINEGAAGQPDAGSGQAYCCGSPEHCNPLCRRGKRGCRVASGRNDRPRCRR